MSDLLRDSFLYYKVILINIWLIYDPNHQIILLLNILDFEISSERKSLHKIITGRILCLLSDTVYPTKSIKAS